MGGDRPTVLVVDDQKAIVDGYSHWLQEEYAVEVAYDGEAALELLDELEVDAVLLDRRMPGLTGRETLEEMRARGYDQPVAVVTAVDAGLDIVAMPFDAYLTKPVEPGELKETVSYLLDVSSLDTELRELYAMARKRATLAAENDESELRDDHRYTALADRLDGVRRDLGETVTEMDSDEFAAAIDSVVATESPSDVEVEAADFRDYRD